MKQGMTLSDLAIEVKRQKEAAEDYVADTARMQLAVESDGHDETPGTPPLSPVMLLDGANGGDVLSFPIRPIAHAQLGERVKIPKVYYDRMLGEAPELLASNVNHWLHTKPERRMLRILDGHVRAFLSDRYRRLDNAELLDAAVLPTLAEMPDVVIESAALTEQRLYIKATLPTIQGEIRVGDVVCSGVVISNSEVGSGALSVETLLYRLTCLNGAISGLSLRKYHTGRRIEADDEAMRVFADETLQADDAAFFLKVRDLVKAAADEARFQEIVAAAREKADTRIPGDPVGVVERLADRYGLADGERGSILEHLISGGDLTAWGYVNAVTRASQDVDDYERATELERLGGSMIDTPTRDLVATLAL